MENKKPFSPREILAWSSWCTLVDDAYGRLALLLHLSKCALSKPFSRNVFFTNVLSSAPFKKVILEISGLRQWLSSCFFCAKEVQYVGSLDGRRNLTKMPQMCLVSGEDSLYCHK